MGFEVEGFKVIMLFGITEGKRTKKEKGEKEKEGKEGEK